MQIFKGNGGTFIKSVDDNALDSLDYCSEEISRYSKEKVIDQKELNDLIDKIKECKEELGKSESINENLKLIICQQLDGILEAIALYEIVGIEVLEQALEKSYGNVITNKKEFEKIKEIGLQEEPAIQKYFDSMGKLNSMIAFGKNVGESLKGWGSVFRLFLES